MIAKKNLITLAVLAPLAILPHSVFADDDANPDHNAKHEMAERLQIIGHNDKLRKEAGSATLIGEVELEKFKFDDINRVLYNVPGVNIREEDGYGLRPNIGFRGVTPERSKKITVMEDGILIGPAPYSAPAAYYFPMMSKMTSLEVFKGPSAIKYGPNTVAGALNMTTRSVPDDSEGAIDFSGGSHGFAKAKLYYGNTNGDFGYLVDVAHLEADGFKELDGGGDTGFEKQDALIKLNYDLSSGGNSQLIELKFGYATETSDETYLGLTDQDFANNANRRYVASQNDLMDWEHQQVQLTHYFSNDDVDVTTRLYRNDFERSWNKISGFKGGQVDRKLQDILAAPEDEVNALFYQVLTGQRDTGAEYEKIILGDNFRTYYSQGIQSELNTSLNLAGFEHKVSVGVRYHEDQIKRRHTEQSYFMKSASLEHDGNELVATTTNLEETDALSVYIQDTINFDDLDLTFGLRGEFFDSYYQNQRPGSENDWQKKSSKILLPSISGFYTLSKNAGILFGIHEGFVPTSPQEQPEIAIENSVNYELGGRYNDGAYQYEAVVFYNDISNLKESCSFSTADSCGDALDSEFNGGEVDVYGLELSASNTVQWGNGLESPLSIVYTHTASEFQSSFVSDFPMWGTVTAGDELPYLPSNQLTLSIGIVGNMWDANLIARHIGEMQEASGQDVLLSNVTTEAYNIVDLSAHYDLDQFGRFYVKLDNILDEQVIVSRRPYGARPSKPRQFQIGYQYSF